MKSALLKLSLCICVLALSSCASEAMRDSRPVVLKFSLKLDADVYSQSNYKKPPQFAIWLERATGPAIRTVWVSEKTGTGDWGGKTTRPVSLPYWVSRWNIETQSQGLPSPENPAIDAVTGATPKEELAVEVTVPAGSVWNYFIETNVSGDYNEAFPITGKDGKTDRNGNGQPSIIYKGEIISSPGRRSSPELIGRTDQFQNVKEVNRDLTGITTARDLFSAIEVSCEVGK